MLALTTWSAHLPTPGRRRFTAALARLNTMVWQLIEEQRQSGRDRGDLLSLLLASHDPATGERMPAQRVRDEVMTLVFAGHETTALALTWTWYVLARHAEATDRLLREVAGVLAGRVPTMADLPHLPYTRMVLEEALRLYPPVWMIARAARADNVIGGYPIPAQTTIFLSPYITHRHPAFWADQDLFDPDLFDPERFAPHQTVSRPPCTYFPFAAGPRACLGAQLAMVEAQLILAQVIQVYGVDVIAGQRITPQPALTLQPRNGVHVILRPRSARGS
jgi:cytochrome P450